MAADTCGITVRLAHGAVAYPEGGVWCVIITAVNRSDHAVNIVSAGLVMQDGTDREWMPSRPLDISDLPGTIAPHDAASMYIDGRVAEDAFDLKRPLIAWVRDPTIDKPVRSKPVTLLGSDAVLPS